MKFLPGELVVPRLRYGAKKLFLWSAENDFGPHVIVAEIKKCSILTVIKFETFSNIKNKNDEWNDGAYLLMSPDGRLGWAGSGWIKKLPSDSNSKN